MAKFSGNVGYIIEEETAPGVFTQEPIERKMSGDILRSSGSFGANNKVNSDVHIQPRISVVGDAFIYAHFYDIRYVEYLGHKWDISYIEIQRPRVILTLGGRYNG